MSVSNASVHECVSLLRFSMSDLAVYECIILFRFSVTDAAVYKCVSLFRFSMSDAAVYECVFCLGLACLTQQCTSVSPCLGLACLTRQCTSVSQQTPWECTVHQPGSMVRILQMFLQTDRYLFKSFFSFRCPKHKTCYQIYCKCGPKIEIIFTPCGFLKHYTLSVKTIRKRHGWNDCINSRY